MARLQSLLHAVIFGCVALSVMAAPASARDIYVATWGADYNSGGPSDPYRTIKHAVSVATYGDTIHVKAGTYAEGWINIKSGVKLVSEDGLYAARIFSGPRSAVRFVGIHDAEIDGFEIWGSYGQGDPGDGLVRIYNSYNITVRNCLIHDASCDCDCIKIGGSTTQTTNVLIENCVVYNPAPRTAGGFQECIDIYPADGVTVRHCWLYLTPDKKGDYIMYAKGGSRNILWEYNIIGPDYSAPYSNPTCSAGCQA